MFSIVTELPGSTPDLTFWSGSTTGGTFSSTTYRLTGEIVNANVLCNGPGGFWR
ncbi:MAG: hypothetical protein WBX81_13615 [Nitrososphaeraceae archaeon]